jgi:hypothetical protein
MGQGPLTGTRCRSNDPDARKREPSPSLLVSRVNHLAATASSRRRTRTGDPFGYEGRGYCRQPVRQRGDAGNGRTSRLRISNARISDAGAVRQYPVREGGVVTRMRRREGTYRNDHG